MQSLTPAKRRTRQAEVSPASVTLARSPRLTPGRRSCPGRRGVCTPLPRHAAASAVRPHVNCPRGHLPLNHRAPARAHGTGISQRTARGFACGEASLPAAGNRLQRHIPGRAGAENVAEWVEVPEDFAVFCGFCPCSEHRDRRRWLCRTPWCGVFFSSASLHFLQFRISPKPSPSTEWTSPDTVPWLSGGMKKPWVTGAVWGCDTLAGASGIPLVGICLSGCSQCGLQDGRVSMGQGAVSSQG